MGEPWIAAVRSVLRGVRDLLDLVAPTTCAACGIAGPALCRACRAALPVTAMRIGSVGAVPVLALGRHDGPWRRVLLEWKEQGRGALAPHLAQVLAAALPLESVVLVPMPTRAQARRRRGLALIDDLARRTAARGRQRWLPALHLTRHTIDQVGLSAQQRQGNVAGSLVARPRAARRLQQAVSRGAAIVVLDDIVTTGATARAAVQALQGVGVPVSAVLALAVAPHPGSRRPPVARDVSRDGPVRNSSRQGGASVLA